MGSFLGKVLMLDQLKRRGRKLANMCFLCEEDEETIDHLLVHCPSVRMLWFLFLAVDGFNWVFPSFVWQNLLSWQRAPVGKKRKEIWMAAPLYLFWTIWQERNMAAFDNQAPSFQRMKVSFLTNLWSWARMYSVDNTNSLINFFVLVRA